MKVLLLNGSPHEKGCTYTALSEVAAALEGDGVAAEILWLGASPATGCLGCGGCRRTGRCVRNDIVNDIIERLEEYDGLVVGSPVHYASASGQITGVLDRLFYAAGGKLRYKPGAAVVSARRGVSSRYWNMVHGNTPDEVRQDEEGLSVMRTLGHNMAWLLKCIAAGRAAGVGLPMEEPPAKTNFIR